MGRVRKITEDYFDSQGVLYDVRNDGTLSICMGDVDNIGTVRVFIIFDEDDDVSLRACDICKVPDNKKTSILKAISDMNSKYRWVRFYLDQDDMTITAATDALLEPETCGEEVFELLMRLVGICGETYPVFMRAIYA